MSFTQHVSSARGRMGRAVVQFGYLPGSCSAGYGAEL